MSNHVWDVQFGMQHWIKILWTTGKDFGTGFSDYYTDKSGEFSGICPCLVLKAALLSICGGGGRGVEPFLAFLKYL